MLRFVCIVVVFAATILTMCAVAVTLRTVIPEGANVWVRLAISVPCIFIAPLSVELVLIAIIRRLDRKGWLGIH